ncbi:MAG: hypothetical protein A2177_06140 [Spirochaetes bacterium RBG_13_68_11]|nr:MAG: hypothetical protein A2177_06140 [Spirochaetes bacterium RBG_13_68_11]
MGGIEVRGMPVRKEKRTALVDESLGNSVPSNLLTNAITFSQPAALWRQLRRSRPKVPAPTLAISQNMP